MLSKTEQMLKTTTLQNLPLILLLLFLFGSKQQAKAAILEIVPTSSTTQTIVCSQQTKHPQKPADLPSPIEDQDPEEIEDSNEEDKNSKDLTFSTPPPTQNQLIYLQQQYFNYCLCHFFNFSKYLPLRNQNLVLLGCEFLL